MGGVQSNYGSEDDGTMTKSFVENSTLDRPSAVVSSSLTSADVADPAVALFSADPAETETPPTVSGPIRMLK